MSIRVTSVGNDDKDWLIEFTRTPVPYASRKLTVVVRVEGAESLDEAINQGAGFARIWLESMEQFNKNAEAHDG
jgi:hypothetical protein